MKLKTVLLGLLIVSIAIFVGYKFNSSPPSRNTDTQKHNSSESSDTAPQASVKYPLDEASSLWVVVNKGRQLPPDYAPKDLRAPNIPLRLSASASEMLLRDTAATSLEKMTAEAKTQGINLMLASGYRSYSSQSALYNRYVSQDGQASADSYSARAGHSEHQTGLAADVEPASRQCEVEDCFAQTAEGKWLADNCYKYGFIIRYQQNTENLTGYKYEPWHIRYVGADLSSKLKTSAKTLEQYFNLTTYATYPAESLQLKDR